MAPIVDFGPVQYGCTKYKRRMVLFESLSHPGKRFEFCYSSSYQDKRGVETAYYKCVGCMHAKCYNDGRRIPKIAVREGRLVNSNPDRPSNFPHFCQPIDSALSERRQRERGQQHSSSTTQIDHHQHQQEQHAQSSPTFAQQPQPTASAAPPQSNVQQMGQQQMLGGSPHRQQESAPSAAQATAAVLFGGAEIGAATALNNMAMGRHHGHGHNVPPSSTPQHPPLPPHPIGTQQFGPTGSMQAAMQQQIQQLAANCFVSPATAPTAASQHFLLGMGMAAAAGGCWTSTQMDG